MNIGILDYGAGNLRSVYRAVNHLGFEYTKVSSSSDFDCLDKLIIPGVGAFRVAMEQLHDNNLVNSVKKYSSSGMPIMGICLGMQLLFSRSSEFGNAKGLDIIKGSILHIRDQYQKAYDNRINVPHVGWSSLESYADDVIFEAIDKAPLDCYFVHSFMACNVPDENILAVIDYCGLKIPAAVRVKNTYGLQFHPEKSGPEGLKMIKNFLEHRF